MTWPIKVEIMEFLKCFVEVISPCSFVSNRIYFDLSQYNCQMLYPVPRRNYFVEYRIIGHEI
jgi:hypothetical protein